MDETTDELSAASRDLIDSERTNKTDSMMQNLTPKEIVAQLDRYIVGQSEAKRAVSIAIRNRWRRQQLPAEMRQEVSPKNILMIGSTGVGKTEIARRLAKLTGAPFIKVEATKYTEVGYYGRDVESMVRELVDNAISLLRSEEREKVKATAEERTNERLLDLLCPTPAHYEFAAAAPGHSESGDAGPANADADSYDRTRAKMKKMLLDGDLDDRSVEITVEQKSTPVMMGGIGVEQMDMDFQGMLEKIMPTSRKNRQLKVAEARKVIFEQECDAMLDADKINSQAIELAENSGIVFLDEIDKVIASESKSADVSRQGVQRDLLPIVEGTSVQTKHGYINTDHILFIAAGAFHRHQPSELMPELQGRFPIRVELDDLTTEDFVRILTEPKNSLTRQYSALLDTEGVQLEFTEDAIQELATVASRVNDSTMNIGARRLYTILEHLLEELSFEAPGMTMGEVTINAAYVQEKLGEVSHDEDLSKYIL
jgi:ATP-dependent HslUV protease ATP-binding subunit HslU